MSPEVIGLIISRDKRAGGVYFARIKLALRTKTTNSETYRFLPFTNFLGTYYVPGILQMLHLNQLI